MRVSVKVETDRALVSSPCLRLRAGRTDWFMWWDRRPRFARYTEPEDAK